MKESEIEELIEEGSRADREGNGDLALEKYKQALAQAKQIDNKELLGRILNSIGLLYSSWGRHEEALQYLQQAIQVRDQIGKGKTLDDLETVYIPWTPKKKASQTSRQRNREVEKLTMEGVAAFREGKGDLALEKYNQALAQAKQIDDKTLIIWVQNIIGMFFKMWGRYEEAIQYYQQALQTEEQVGNKVEKGTTLNMIGEVYSSWGRYKEAIVYYQQALEIKEQLGDMMGKYLALHAIGNVYCSWGHYGEALQYKQQALQFAEQVDNVEWKNGTLNAIGTVYSSWGRYDEALQSYQQALQIEDQVGDKVGKGATLSTIGELYCLWGRYEEALQSYQEALQIREQIGAVEAKCETLINIGNVYQLLERYEKALQYYQQALQIPEEGNDVIVNRKGRILYTIGTVYDALRQYKEALQFYQQALQFAVKVGHMAWQANILHSIGGVYKSWRRYEEALQFYQQALQIAAQIGDMAGQVSILHSIGWAYESQRRYEEALQFYRQALHIAAQVGDVARQGDILHSIGGVYDNQGQYEEALQYYQQALQILDQVGNIIWKGITLNSIGLMYDNWGRYEEALQYYQRALQIEDQVGNMTWKGITLNNIGSMYTSWGRYEEALQYYQQTIDLYEGLIGRTESEEVRKTYRGTLLAPYRGITRMLIAWYKRDRDGTHLAECLKYLELAKAREIIDKLETKQISIQTCPKLAELLQAEQKLVLEIEELHLAMKMERSQGKARSVSEGDLTEKGAQLRKLRAELMAKCQEPGLIRVTSEFDPMPDFQELFEREPVVLWEFISFPEEAFYKDRFRILSWDGVQLQLWETNPFDRERLLKLVNSFYQNIAENKMDEANACLTDIQHDLDALIPEKALITLDQKKKLILIPHEALHLFPWEITEKLGLKLPLVRSYSLSILRSCMKREAKAAPKNALLVSNPNFNDKDLNLEGADLEVNSIQTLLKKAKITTQPLKHETATEENFVKATGQALNIIHFAGHGTFNQVENDPWMSGLLFYKSTGFDIRTVLELVTQRFKGTPLFVLSACETARSEFFTGDELVGLIRGLTLAGITSILATNWVLGDRVAPYFMQTFYTHFLQGKDVCQSLFEARQDLIQQGFTHPFDWGVYTLYGNPFKKFQE